ncbi:DUF2254 domain-containing protein [Denitrificimonas caeni]|uniref:DUF2254 domain-containing protein n=1 Tax=Denitrificimonas caeni TaxID=521720 RepID=UPI0022B6F388|nr:DUF2254 domain-containing protein [Denitrificimonas caeni]
MGDRLRFFINRIRERLWIKPLVMSVLSAVIVFLVKVLDIEEIGQFVPRVTQDSIETLLTILSGSMLMIATFAVGSMVAAYSSASNNATPRAFSLIISDDVSQNALSTFIGAFIYSVVALIAMKNGYYGTAGRFVLFVLTVLILIIVIVTFVRWVDRIARLGRLKGTINKVEAATASAFKRRRHAPTLGGVPAWRQPTHGSQVIYGTTIGSVQQVNVTALQACAEKLQVRITLTALPGTFSAPGRALAFITRDSSGAADLDISQIAKAFLIGDDRKFEEDPRFGLVVLSEIAGRALSPAVNDPGTAIYIIGVFVRLFALWCEPIEEGDRQEGDNDRVEVPEISVQDMFDDAFTAIARDGASTVEVAGRLQKAFESLAFVGDSAMRDAALRHARMALARAEKALQLPEDLQIVRELAGFANEVQLHERL